MIFEIYDGNRLFLLLSLFLALPLLDSCSDPEVEFCRSNLVKSEEVSTQVSMSCRNVDISSDLNFGLDIEFLFEFDCGLLCEESTVSFIIDIVVKDDDSIKLLSNGEFVIDCNRPTPTAITLTSRDDDFQSVDYMVGDSVIFTRGIPEICISRDSMGCESLELLSHLPDFKFVYIIAPTDFDC